MPRGHPDFKFSAYVQTLAADNLVLDLITARAFTPITRSLENEGPVVSWAAATGAERHGKYFPRGARGFIEAVGVRCRDIGTAGGKLTFYLSPSPGFGPIFSAEVKVPAGADEAVRIGNVRRIWQYDSLFIYVLSSSPEIQYAYDVDKPRDAFESEDGGITWFYRLRRYHFRISMHGQTCGDLPVSGVVNAIQIPNRSSTLTSDVVSVDAGETKKFLEIKGMGFTQFLCIYAHRTLGSTPAENIYVIFTIDDVSKEYNISGLRGLVGDALNTPTPIVFTEIDDTVGGQYYTFWWKTPFYFRKLFKLEAKNTLTESGNIFNMATTYQIARVV